MGCGRRLATVDSVTNAVLLGLFAGIGASLRHYLMLGVYRVCRLAPPRSRVRKVLLGGAGFYYGWIAVALVVGLLIHAGSSAS
jgi:biotin transporter BioY